MADTRGTNDRSPCETTKNIGPKAPNIKRLLPTPDIASSPFAARYASGIFDEDGGFHQRRDAELHTILRDAALAIRRFVGWVKTVGKRDSESAWVIAQRDRRIVRQLWEEFTLICQGAVTLGLRFVEWMPSDPAGTALVTVVGRMKEGRGVETFPATISALASKATFALLVTDLDGGLLSGEAVEQLVAIADQLESEARLLTPQEAGLLNAAPDNAACRREDRRRSTGTDPAKIDVVVRDQEWAEFKIGEATVARLKGEDCQPNVWCRLLEFASAEGALKRPVSVYGQRGRKRHGGEEGDFSHVAIIQEAKRAKLDAEAWRKGVDRLNQVLRTRVPLSAAPFTLQGDCYRSTFKSIQMDYSAG